MRKSRGRQVDHLKQGNQVVKKRSIFEQKDGVIEEVPVCGLDDGRGQFGN
jgi:hypothetical protein